MTLELEMKLTWNLNHRRIYELKWWRQKYDSGFSAVNYKVLLSFLFVTGFRVPWSRIPAEYDTTS